MVLERIVGIRVLTSSELESPTDEPVKHWKNSAWDPKDGKARPNYDGPSHGAKKTVKPEKKAKGGKWKCKNCGELGHSAKTCKNPAKLPDQEIKNIVNEERAIEPIT
jgi:hypothetical protein